jgi:hypothetical protein
MMMEVQFGSHRTLRESLSIRAVEAIVIANGMEVSCILLESHLTTLILALCSITQFLVRRDQEEVCGLDQMLLRWCKTLMFLLGFRLMEAHFISRRKVRNQVVDGHLAFVTILRLGAQFGLIASFVLSDLSLCPTTTVWMILRLVFFIRTMQDRLFQH